MKAEGYLTHADIVAMTEEELVAEYGLFAEIVEQRSRAARR